MKTFKRLRTGCIFWDDARQVASRWESAGSWSAAAPATDPTPAPAQPERMTVESAVDAYLAFHEKASSFNTGKRYRSVLRRIVRYAQHTGHLFLDEWQQADIIACRNTWSVALRTANAEMSVLKSFFEWCIDNEWITTNPARKVKGYRSRDAKDVRGQQKLPFSNSELEKMYAACDLFADTATKEVGRPSEVTGRDLRDFIVLGISTGLRISDLATFNSSRMNEKGEILIRTTKSGTDVHTWVPVPVQEMIRRRSAEIGPLIFGSRRAKSTNAKAAVWRDRLERLWDLCGPWEARPTPHRMRHTFARLLLETDGISILDVATLLGNTEAMVRKHYGAWIRSRQEQLTAKLQSAFRGTPTPWRSE